MAYTVKILSGEGTIDFIGSNDYVILDQGLQFTPLAKKQVWTGGSSYLQGAKLISSSFENRTIKILLKVTGTTRDDLISHITLIERTLERARRNAIYKSGERVELQFKVDGATNTSYFEILDGELEWPNDLLSVDNILQMEGSRYVIYDFTLTLDCYPLAFNISPYNGTPTSLPLTNGNGTNVTTGIAVENHDDATAGHDNWVSINGADIKGDYPCLTKLQLQTDAEIDYATMKIHVGVEQNPTANLKTFWEDTDAAVVWQSPSPTADAGCSGGYYTTVSYSTAPTDLFRWGTTVAQAQAMKGAYRVFGRANNGANMWDLGSQFKMDFYFSESGLATFSTGYIKPKPNIYNYEQQILDFGTVFINQDYAIASQADSFGFRLVGVSDPGTGAKSLSLDYIYFLPINGGYRVLQARSFGEKSVTFVDDGWLDATYQLSGGYAIPYAYGLMPRISLLPGKTQKLFFLMQSADWESAEISRGITAKVYYVPQFNVLV